MRGTRRSQKPPSHGDYTVVVDVYYPAWPVWPLPSTTRASCNRGTEVLIAQKNSVTRIRRTIDQTLSTQAHRVKASLKSDLDRCPGLAPTLHP